jgi:DNA-binding MarR family transcriptional regulator
MWDRLDPRADDSRELSARDPRELEERDPRDVFTSGLDLPRGPERERVYVDEQAYDLRGSEARALATIGAFRVVPASDVRDDHGRRGDLRHGDLERLRDAGLIRRIAPAEGERRTALVTLTDRGRDLLEHQRRPDQEPGQRFYAGPSKSRELTHDAQLYRAYLRSADRLHAQGARVERVVLDDDLKREYQEFLQSGNRDRSDSDGRPTRTLDDIREWAQEHGLPMLDDSVQFPDVRIEYEWPDGRRDIDDVEVLTPHYRGAHAAAKGRSGFTCYRGGGGGRVGGRGSQTARGDKPFDPDLADEFLR